MTYWKLYPATKDRRNNYMNCIVLGVVMILTSLVIGKEVLKGYRKDKENMREWLNHIEELKKNNQEK